MNREDIIRMALEAGLKKQATGWSAWTVDLERFAALVAAAAIKDAPDYKMGYADGVASEREKCAKVCEGYAVQVADIAWWAAKAIRSREQV